MNAAIGGDAHAFETLVRQHQGAVRAWLRRLTDDPDAADELAQETFVAAWQKLESFAGHGTFKSWLFALAYRALLTRIRRAKRQQEVLDCYASEVTGRVSGDEAVLDIEPALATLSDPERQCLVLTHVYGLTVDETSTALVLPPGTVKSHVHRAKRRLSNLHALET